MTMAINRRYETPVFGNVKVVSIFYCKRAAEKAGFTEDAGFSNSRYGILGKRLNPYSNMMFVAYKKPKGNIEKVIDM